MIAKYDVKMFSMYDECEWRDISEDDVELYGSDKYKMKEYLEQYNLTETDEYKWLIKNFDKVLFTIQVDVDQYYFMNVK